MGWTYYDACHYTKSGSVDRKKELDLEYWGNDKRYKVLKSSMVGSAYYAAIREEDTGKVFAAVFLTSTAKGGYYNFGYKDMTESCGPCAVQCPKSILDLLTPTDNKYANEWRTKCREYIESKKSPYAFSKLPPGTKIIWTVPHEHFVNFKKGERIELEKYKPRGQRRSLWVHWKTHCSIRPAHVDIKDIEFLHNQ